MSLHLKAQTQPIPAEGSGTINDPYLIANLANLRWLSENYTVWGATTAPVHIVQTDNIDATETRFWNNEMGFSPIGTNSYHFRGVYDGQNYSIDNLYMNWSHLFLEYYIGLIGMASSSTLKNIVLINNDFYLQDNSSYGSHIGGILGYGINTSISDCYTTGNISMVSDLSSIAGGIAGYISGSISNCFTTGNVNATTLNNGDAAWAGGIAGFGSGSISFCYSTGDITSTSHYAYAGGIVGVGSCSISNSFSTGNITTTYDDWVIYFYNEYSIAGGIAAFSGGHISSCYSFGNITAISMENEAVAGGIVGRSTPHSITNSYSTGNITAISEEDYGWGDTAYSGGILGRGIGSISNCYAKGSINALKVTMTAFSGGISGVINNNVAISNCFWDIETTGQEEATSEGTPDTSSGLPTSEMQNIENYLNSGWDFENIWGMSGYINDGYPYLEYSQELSRPVSNLSYTIFENNITLCWDAPIGPTHQLLGYFVIRNQTILTPDPITEITIIDENLEDGFYFYIVFAVYPEGYSTGVYIQVTVNTTSVEDDIILPLQTRLLGNYPNPFNPSTNIRFSLSVKSNLRIDIYNIKGQIIKTLANGFYDLGQHAVTWDGTDSHGNRVSSGVYFYMMTTDEFVETKKMMMVK